MKLKATILVGVLILLGFLSLRIVSSIEPRFSFSFPLRSGGQEIQATLPAGRYALVISTNYSNKTFSEIPPQRDYSSQLTVQVFADKQVLAQGSNSHYLVFSLKKELAAKVKVKLVIVVQEEHENESLVLSLGRGF